MMGSAENPSVSVIVPVYNMEQYLIQCLDSLKSQSLENIEIIVIDDGSTDTSVHICDAYGDDDSRFKVVHTKNQGLSGARNVGLKNARAKYVMFVDSDDWVENDFCEKPYSVAEETDSDIVIFRRIWHQGHEVRCQEQFPIEGLGSQIDILTNQWELTGVVVWNKLYRRELFKDVRFPLGRLSEDTATTHLLIHSAKRIYLLNRCLYHHRLSRPGSIMYEKSDQLIIDEVTFNLVRIKDLNEWGLLDKGKVIDQAFKYLIVVGSNAELSSMCDEILRENMRLTKNTLTYKSRMLFLLYRFLPSMFEVVVRKSGRRIKHGKGSTTIVQQYHG